MFMGTAVCQSVGQCDCVYLDRPMHIPAWSKFVYLRVHKMVARVDMKYSCGAGERTARWEQ